MADSKTHDFRFPLDRDEAETLLNAGRSLRSRMEFAKTFSGSPSDAATDIYFLARRMAELAAGTSLFFEDHDVTLHGDAYLAGVHVGLNVKQSMLKEPLRFVFYISMEDLLAPKFSEAMRAEAYRRLASAANCLLDTFGASPGVDADLPLADEPEVGGARTVVIQTPQLTGGRPAVAPLLERNRVPEDLRGIEVILDGHQTAGSTADFADQLVRMVLLDRHASKLTIRLAGRYLTHWLQEAAVRHQVSDLVVLDDRADTVNGRLN